MELVALKSDRMIEYTYLFFYAHFQAVRKKVNPRYEPVNTTDDGKAA